MTDTKISLATINDLAAILDLAQEFSDEASEHHKWDRDKVEEALMASFEDDNQVIITLIVDGNIVGALFGVLTSPFLSHKVVATELAWFVTKRYRGRGAIHMISVFEQWAQFNGADSVVMADLAHVANLSPLYNKLGYSRLETNYIKEV